MWMRTGLRKDDLIRISVDHEIRIVGDHDHLPVRLGFDKEMYQLVKDRLRVQVFLWLVDHQRPVVVVIQRQIEQQKHDAARAGR